MSFIPVGNVCAGTSEEADKSEEDAVDLRGGV